MIEGSGWFSFWVWGLGFRAQGGLGIGCLRFIRLVEG